MGCRVQVPGHGAYFYAFDIALATVAFGATYLHWLKHHWRGATMARCPGVVLSHTSMGIAMAQDELLLMTLFAVLLGTAILAPWNLRWQLGLMAADFISFMVVLLKGLVEPDDIQRWLVLAATMALASNFISLKKCYLIAQDRDVCF